jgi:predicted nucleic acid-binding protein
MNIVDSSGWLEYFANGPNSDFFAPVIEDVSQLIVPVISIYEVFKKVLQQRGEGDALQAIAVMSQGKVIELDIKLSLSAAKISVDLGIPMADSMMLATAKAFHATLWTQDEDFKAIEGVRYIKVQGPRIKEKGTKKKR